METIYGSPQGPSRSVEKVRQEYQRTDHLMTGREDVQESTV